MIYLFSKFRFAKVRLSKIEKIKIKKYKLEKMKKAGIGKGMGSRIRRAIEKMDQMALEQMALDEISSSSDESSSSDLNPIFSIFSNLLYLIQKSSLLSKLSSFISKFIIQPLYAVDPEIHIDDTTGYPKIKNVFKNGNNDKKIQEEKILEEKR
jgi:hypothetical protein